MAALTSARQRAALRIRCLPRETIHSLRGHAAALLGALFCASLLAYLKRRRVGRGRHASPVRIVLKGQPLRSLTADELSVISYNVLADCYTNNAKLKYVNPAHLQWSHRWPLLKEQLIGFDADLICLQEVEVSRWDNFCSAKELQHYTFLMQERSAGQRVANALLFRSAKLHLLWSESRTRVLLAAFSSVDGWGQQQVVHVVNVHLEGSPYRPNDRVSQMRSALQRLHQRQQEAELEPALCSVLVAGDFNSRPGETVYQLLHRGRLEGGSTEWYLPQVPVTKVTIAHPYLLHNAYDAAGVELPFTYHRQSPPAASILDMVWCSEHLRVCGVYWPLLSEEMGTVQRCGLPNQVYPSDHLPIGVIVSLVGTFCNEEADAGMPTQDT